MKTTDNQYMTIKISSFEAETFELFFDFFRKKRKTLGKTRWKHVASQTLINYNFLISIFFEKPLMQSSTSDRPAKVASVAVGNDNGKKPIWIMQKG